MKKLRCLTALKKIVNEFESKLPQKNLNHTSANQVPEESSIDLDHMMLIFSSTGRRPASLCHGPLSVVRGCVHPSVRALTFSLNIFFAETTYRILMKFHRNVPTMVFFRIS